MFNNKLKAKIKELEQQVSDANKKVKDQENEIKFLKWKLENPSRYKIGDRIGELIVIERIIKKPELIKIVADVIELGLMLINMKRNINISKERKEYLEKIFHNQWEYELINTTTGERIKKKEFELKNKK